MIPNDKKNLNNNILKKEEKEIFFLEDKSEKEILEFKKKFIDEIIEKKSPQPEQITIPSIVTTIGGDVWEIIQRGQQARAETRADSVQQIEESSEETTETISQISSGSMYSFDYSEREEDLEEESDLYKSLSEATEEIKDSKALQR